MSQLIIRQAEEKDIRPIAELEKQCFSRPWSQEAINNEIMQNGLALYLVSETDGQITGYVGLWCIGDEGHITNIAVHPQHRRKHIAAALIQCLLDFTEKEGIKKHTLEVRAGNTAARELYGHFGFTDCGIRKGYYDEGGEDAVIMWRLSE